MSFVYPHKRWALAVYRHELVNFKANVTSQGFFFDALSNNPDNGIVPFRSLPSRVKYDLNITNYGASAAYRLNDRFSAGVGLTYYDFSLESTTQKYALRTAARTGNSGDFYGPPLFTPENRDNLVEETGSTSGIGANLGLLWKVTDNWSLGAVYRKGHSFETRRTLTLQKTSPQTITNSQGRDFTIPDAISIGTAFKPEDQMTLTIDLNHIQYTQTNQGADPVRTDNVNEVHFGFEYVLLRQQKPEHPISFRLGSWLDPDHQPSFRGLPDEHSGNRRRAAGFLQGKDEWHYSAGLGFVLGKRFQFDGAYDYSDLVSTFPYPPSTASRIRAVEASLSEGCRDAPSPSTTPFAGHGDGGTSLEGLAAPAATSARRPPRADREGGGSSNKRVASACAPVRHSR